MIRVLLIEDDPMVQEVNKQFIEKVEGFQVVEKAGNGKEGIEKLEKYKTDLVILDVYMPNQDGLEVLYHIRKEQFPVDVITVTAANDQETIRKMLQNGAVDYIIKPFKFERIQQALENYKRYTRKLSEKSSVSQDYIDEILHKKVKDSSEEVDIPKGLNQLTLNQISKYLDQQKEAKSAEDVAEGVGLARVTARRYLEYMKKIGHIKLDMQYGGVGRPVNRYIKK
ncbi:response regulator [Pontibacillus marinus]|uniref:Chemotaxis protein CheY n=1 Tax=Pontibacillus marinus BH030004 = DSM 16465 TaxID=1385511 RepID=A0A0A5GEX2_9BACI|nr:response regulator [Pontibacillus marinus]KGX89675.1 chemotaxis protein CheY [Pontibacillus marinus BH030004 = DSM 16465]